MAKNSNFHTALHKRTKAEAVLFVNQLSKEEKDKVRVDCEGYCETFLGASDGAAELLQILDGKFPDDFALPGIDSNSHGVEKEMQVSIRVLVLISQWPYPMVARYVARDGYWEVAGVQGKVQNHKIIEWWQIPVRGSGIIPPRCVLLRQ